MKYQSVLLILIFTALLTAPAAANLKKIAPEAPVFVGETAVDISSALNGCRQIAWWPAGNDTDTLPGKILDIPENKVYSYNFTPDIFSEYTGKWYCYNPKPIIQVFDLQKPFMNLTIWGLDNNIDVTGQTIPAGTRVTYRIDTNLYPVLDKLDRPGVTMSDSFMVVTLTKPGGKPIESIYTLSAGGVETQVLVFDGNPRVKESPYYWKDGARWNRSARSGDGGLIYPPGTYTFVLSQNLNGMSVNYAADDPALTTGPVTVTFTANEPVATTPSVIKTATSKPETTAPVTPETTAPMRTETSTIPVKTTWTSTPLPAEITLLSLCIAFACCLSLTRKSR